MQKKVTKIPLHPENWTCCDMLFPKPPKIKHPLGNYILIYIDLLRNSHFIEANLGGGQSWGDGMTATRRRREGLWPEAAAVSMGFPGDE